MGEGEGLRAITIATALFPMGEEGRGWRGPLVPTSRSVIVTRHGGQHLQPRAKLCCAKHKHELPPHNAMVKTLAHGLDGSAWAARTYMDCQILAHKTLKIGSF